MTDLSDLNLSNRTYNCLKRAGINTLEELREISKADLQKIRNLGPLSLNEVLKVRNSYPEENTFKWIPIDKKCPPTGEALIVTIYDTYRQTNELRYPVYYRQSCYCDKYYFYLYGIEENILLPEFSKIVAWMPMPKPYEGGCQDEN